MGGGGGACEKNVARETSIPPWTAFVFGKMRTHFDLPSRDLSNTEEPLSRHLDAAGSL